MSTLFYRNRYLLTLSIVIVLVGGLSAIFTLPRLEDPRISNRNAVIVTVLPGASAERVEALVTEKLEEELRELSEIDEITSISRAGVSLLTVALKGKITDTEPVWAKLRDKLADAERLLPPEALPPDFDETRAPPAFTLLVGLSWQGESEPQEAVLKRLGEELADRLRNVRATDIVRVYGEAEEEITVTVDPDEVAALGLSIDDIGRRVADADSKVPAGALRGSASDVFIEVAGELDSLERIASIPLRDGVEGELLRLGDIATLERAPRQPRGELALVGGRPGVLVAARVEANQRVDLWARNANAVVDRFERELAGGVGVERVFDQSFYTLSRLGTLVQNLILGGCIVVGVILFTMGWRSALLVAAAVPLSASSVLFGLNLSGVPLHQISVTGLIIALGLLIDNAIVMVEEVHHRMRDGSRLEAIAGAVGHLFVPLLGSTLTTVISFLPIFLLSGNVGEFVYTIAVSVILALLSSFTIAMTILPALVGVFGRVSGSARSWWQNGFHSPRLAAGFRRAVTLAVRRPVLGLGAVAILPLIGFASAAGLENQFFPPADRDQFYLQMWLPSESSITGTRDRALAVEEVLRRDAAIRRVDWVVGGSAPAFYYNMLMNEDGAANYAQALIQATDYAAMRRSIPRLQAELDAGFPEAQIVLRLLGQGPPVDAPIEIRLYGPSLDQLRELGDDLRRRLIEVPEVLHTRATLAAGEPKLELRADENEARLAGLSLVEVASQLEGALEGRIGGSVLEETENLPVRVRYADSERSSLGNIASLNLRPSLVSGAAGEADREPGLVPLSGLGELELTSVLRGIPRRDGERLNTIKGYLLAGALPPEVTKAFTDRLAAQGFELPPGYRMEFGGEAEEQGEAIADLFTYAPVLLVLMVSTIVLSFRSVKLAGLLGVVALLSAGLGVLAIWISGLPYGFMALIGTAGLIGVAINDSIVVLAAIRARPEAAEGEVEPIVDEVMGTSRHIFSTTLTTAGGFLPLLVAGGVLWPPLAVVIAGGVAGATFLALLFVPAAYAFMHPASRGATRPAAESGATLPLTPAEVES